MSSDKIKISGTSKEEWEKTKFRLDFLPNSVIQQIESAETIADITRCYLKKVYKTDPKIYIPRELVRQITADGDRVCIYCFDFYFEAHKEEFTYQYIFVEK